MSLFSSPSDADPFGFLVSCGTVASATTGSAWLQAMLDAEAALTAAMADLGLVAQDAAATIGDACRADRFDVDAVFEAAALDGNPVIPLVSVLRAAVGEPAASHVHRGATSQDIVDTAAMLVIQRSSRLLIDELGQLVDDVGSLAQQHGDAAMIGRTLMQYAVPTTFGALAARWRSGIADATERLQALDGELFVQLGGPVGDLGSFGEHGQAIVERMADRLGLRTPVFPWHTQRAPMAATAGVWGLTAASLGTIALDIVLLAQSDVAEVAERSAGAGRSSSMVHKRNPIAAVSGRAAAMQAPGLVATLLQCAGGHELQRAAGAWHGEWPALNALLRATGSAAHWLAVSVERLVVDEARMAANLASAATSNREHEDDRPAR